jgi:hypothetical protein
MKSCSFMLICYVMYLVFHNLRRTDETVCEFWHNNAETNGNVFCVAITYSGGQLMYLCWVSTVLEIEGNIMLPNYVVSAEKIFQPLLKPKSGLVSTQ